MDNAQAHELVVHYVLCFMLPGYCERVAVWQMPKRILHDQSGTRAIFLVFVFERTPAKRPEKKKKDEKVAAALAWDYFYYI